LTAALADPAGFPGLSDEHALRRLGRDLAGPERGIVSVDRFLGGKLPSAQVIYKGQQGLGHTYTGILLVPIERDLHMLTVVCEEGGITGLREAVVTAKLVEEGKLEIEEYQHPDEHGATGAIKGWLQDPYDPGYAGPILRSVADDEIHDASLPGHPLARLRSTLAQIRGTLRYGS
jgi:hypothetical protein